MPDDVIIPPPPNPPCPVDGSTLAPAGEVCPTCGNVVPEVANG